MGTKKENLGMLLFGEPTEMGRFAEYHDVYATQVVNHAARCEGTYTGVADAFNVDVSTIKRWLEKYEAFRIGFEEGRSRINDSVVSSLTKIATGFTIQESRVNVVDGDIVITKIDKHVTPSIRAIEFYLTNRASEDWSDTQVIEHVVPLAEGLLAARKRLKKSSDE